MLSDTLAEMIGSPGYGSCMVESLLVQATSLAGSSGTKTKHIKIHGTSTKYWANRCRQRKPVEWKTTEGLVNADSRVLSKIFVNLLRKKYYVIASKAISV